MYTNNDEIESSLDRYNDIDNCTNSQERFILVLDIASGEEDVQVTGTYSLDADGDIYELNCQCKYKLTQDDLETITYFVQYEHDNDKTHP
jgi:hypothetical protein